MRHPVPTDAKRGAYDLVTAAGLVERCQSCDVTTIAALEAALAASQRLRRLSATMETALRRQIATARQAEREQARRGPEIVDDRILQMRRERGAGDLAIPGVGA